MRIATIVATAAATVTLSVSALAAGGDEWVQYAESSNDTKFFIKPSMAKKVGGLWYVWIKQVPKQPGLVDEQNPKGKKWTYALSRQAVYCANETLSAVSRIEYDANGVSVGSYDFPMNLKAVIPDSTGEQLVNAVCTYIDTKQ